MKFLKNYKFLVVFFLFVFTGFAQSQYQVKIMSYNPLAYPGSDTATRHPYYRTIVSSVNPDILVVQEISSQSGLTGFLNGVMNYSGNIYSAGTFIDGPDTDNGIFYKTALFLFLGNTPIHTDLRDINEFKIVHILTHDTLRIYSVHLKASTGSANELSRAAEVDSLRKVTNALSTGTNFLVCGDFNIYGSTEAAYQKLLAVTTGEGQFYDPITTMTGTWNNGAYAQYHTQSPRVRSFGGGATGGMDDRFDLMLYSKAVRDAGGIIYNSGSLTAYGNDGNHYNDSINRQPNTAVSVAIANAIHYASDHIPVYESFTFSPTTNIQTIGNSNVPPASFNLMQNYPNPFNPTTNIKFDIPQDVKRQMSNVKLIIYDILGNEVQTLVNQELSAGSYSVDWNGLNYSSGMYFCRITSGDFQKTIRMTLIK
jgi:exonuclease III